MLIETKTHPPEIGTTAVTRPELLALLDQATVRRLALVSAPTGFGKTTLLSQWAATLKQQGAAVGWFSADASDDDLETFLKYLVAALRKADPESLAELSGLLTSSPILPTETILAKLVNRLSERQSDMFLVIDDFHVIRDSAVIRFMEALLSYAPPCLHIVMGTRNQVPFHLAGMRARDQLVEIDEKQLRFSLAQTTHFLKRDRALDVSEVEIMQLHHRTEGWITGLHLVSLSLGDVGDRAEFLGRFNGAKGNIANFLIHEILDHQPADIHDFLLCTSIFDRFCAPLADAVANTRDAASMIGRIRSANLFLTRLDPQEEWYRYHNLFADLLRDTLRRQDPERLARLHLRAAQWLAGAGLTTEAVHHALAAGERNMAASLVETCCMSVIRKSNIAQTRDWLNRLPQEIIDDKPRLQLAQVWVDFHTSKPRQGARTLRRARDMLVRAEAAGRLSREQSEEQGFELLVLTAGIASAADRPRIALRFTDRALRNIPDHMGFLRGTAGNVAAFCHYSHGDLGAARLACLQARESHATGPYAFGMLYSDVIEGLVDKAAGDLDAALRCFTRARMLATESAGPGSYSEAMVGIFEAEILFERDDLIAAKRLLTAHRPVIEECGLVVHNMSCKLLSAKLAVIDNRIEEALGILAEAERQGLNMRYRRLFSAALHERVKLLIKCGDTRYARLVLTSRGIDTSGSMDPRSSGAVRELEFLAAARVLIAEDRPEAALRVLDPLASKIRADGRYRRLAQVRAVAAVAAYRAGEGLGALAAASDAVTLSAPGGAVRTLIEEGEAFRTVLDFAIARSPMLRDAAAAPAKLVTLLRASGGDDGASSAQRRTPAAHPELSAREAEIGRYLGEGLTNREISVRLSMAPDTVKWHLKNIFGKLGVSNRTHAVLRLQDLGLISTTPMGG